MMTSFATTIVSVFLIFSMGQSSGQKFQATPDGFMGLSLDATTVEEAVGLLGAPDGEKEDKLDASKLEKWLDAKHKEKIFKQLIYKKSPDFQEIRLSFLDGKLVMIDLVYKKRVNAERLRGLFGADFVTLGGPINLPDKPGEAPKGGFITSSFPDLYSAVAISDKTFIIANCASEGNGRDPGRVERTRQISRTLQKKTS
jgi:hypothetical protein